MKTPAIVRMVLVLLPALTVPSSALAGKGKVSQPDENTGVVHVSTTVHVGYPTSQADIDAITNKLWRASRTICDATDGLVLIDDIRLERNGLSAEQADVYWFPYKQISRFNSTGSYYGAVNQRVRVADHISFRAIAHELGVSPLWALRSVRSPAPQRHNGVRVRALDRGCGSQSVQPHDHARLPHALRATPTAVGAQGLRWRRVL